MDYLSNKCRKFDLILMIYACGFDSPSTLAGYFVQIAIIWGQTGYQLPGVERYLRLGGSKCTISLGRAIRLSTVHR